MSQLPFLDRAEVGPWPDMKAKDGSPLHHLLLSSAPPPRVRHCSCLLSHGRGRETGSHRCQQALGTSSSWPRDLGTQTFSSNQGTDSIEQKCHDLTPRGVGGSKKRKEFSRLSPRSLLCPPVGPGSGTSRGQGTKGEFFSFRGRLGLLQFSESQLPLVSSSLLRV